MPSKYVRCKECGKYGLVWMQTHKGWRLAWPKSGKIHMCKAGKAWAERQANPVGTTQSPEVTTNDSPCTVETGVSNDRLELRPTLSVINMVTGRALEAGREASSVRTGNGTVSHLSPTYAYKPRLRCHKFKRNGRVVYNCTQLADGVHIKGMGPTPEVAYDNLLRAYSQYEVERLTDHVAEEPKRRHRWLAGLPIALAIAALFYFFAWVFGR